MFSNFLDIYSEKKSMLPTQNSPAGGVVPGADITEMWKRRACLWVDSPAMKAVLWALWTQVR